MGQNSLVRTLAGASLPCQGTLLRDTCQVTNNHSHHIKQSSSGLPNRWSGHVQKWVKFKLKQSNLGCNCGTKLSMLASPLQGKQPGGSNQERCLVLLYSGHRPVHNQAMQGTMTQDHSSTTMASTPAHHTKPSARAQHTRAGATTASHPDLVIVRLDIAIMI